jgi:hypothetical protein
MAIPGDMTSLERGDSAAIIQLGKLSRIKMAKLSIANFEISLPTAATCLFGVAAVGYCAVNIQSPESTTYTGVQNTLINVEVKTSAAIDPNPVDDAADAALNAKLRDSKQRLEKWGW